MARFRSGTLERSVRRWGRMPKFGGKLQRVQHSWKYVELEEEPQGFTGTGSLAVSLIDAEDWAPTAIGGLGVKNVSIDLAVALTTTPQSNGLLNFNHGYWLYGIFIRDRDDTAAPPIASAFAETRALKWGMMGHSFGGMDQDSGFVLTPERRSWNYRLRCKARYLKFDEEVRWQSGFSSDLSDVFDDVRVSMFGRISWETP